MRPDVEDAGEDEQMEGAGHRGAEVERRRDLGPEGEAGEEEGERGDGEADGEHACGTAEVRAAVVRSVEREHEAKQEEPGWPR